MPFPKSNMFTEFGGHITMPIINHMRGRKENLSLSVPFNAVISHQSLLCAELSSAESREISFFLLTMSYKDLYSYYTASS